MLSFCDIVISVLLMENVTHENKRGKVLYDKKRVAKLKVAERLVKEEMTVMGAAEILVLSTR